MNHVIPEPHDSTDTALGGTCVDLHLFLAMERPHLLGDKGRAGKRPPTPLLQPLWRDHPENLLEANLGIPVQEPCRMPPNTLQSIPA